MKYPAEERDTLKIEDSLARLSQLEQGAQQALETFQYEDAIQIGEQVLALGLDLRTEASFRCLMAEAYELLARFTKAIEVLNCYDEESLAFGLLPPVIQARVALRLAHASGSTSDIPKAISQARFASQLAHRHNEKNIEHQAQILMSILYRRLGEMELAETQLVEILRPETEAEPEILAQALNNLGIIYSVEGKWEAARRTLLRGVDSICDRDAPLLRGSLDVNLAAALTLQGKMREGTILLERALPQLERARNPRLIVNVRSNLGYNLLRLGQMDRARTMLELARTEATACEAKLILASTMETLAELHSIQGRFEIAEELFEQCIASLKALRVSFNLALVKISYGKHWMQRQQYQKAVESFRQSLEISNQTRDPRGQVEAQLYLIKALIRSGNQGEAQTLFETISEQVARLNSLPLKGQYYKVLGTIAAEKGDYEAAIRRFKQAISIWEVLDDPYRHASNQYFIGLAFCKLGDSHSARHYLEAASKIFHSLSAIPRLRLTEDALQNIKDDQPLLPVQSNQLDLLIHSLSALYEADSSSLLTVPEFTRLLHEEFGATPIILFRAEREDRLTVISARGCDQISAEKIKQRLMQPAIGEDEIIRKFQGIDGENFWLYLKRTNTVLADSVLELFFWHLRTMLTKTGQVEEKIDQKISLKASDITLPGIVYKSEAMHQIAEQIYRLQKTNINVLISGESGTGKELIARAVHQLSPRAKQPIVPFNCAAAPRELIESQLFGHRRGAFTGAHSAFSGVVGAASKGTLFLDEIGEMPLDIQPKLLRFLQSGEIQRLGEALPLIVDVRLIAATNCELEQLIKQGQFRADLFYRLNVIRFHLPPLRERREEIAPLARHFISTYSAREDKTDIRLSAAALSCLEEYQWPGNTRELESEIHRVIALSGSGVSILPEHFSSNITGTVQPQPSATVRTKAVMAGKKMTDVLSEIQQDLVNNALAKNDWNISKTARELGISRLGLRTMIRRFNLELPVV